MPSSRNSEEKAKLLPNEEVQDGYGSVGEKGRKKKEDKDEIKTESRPFRHLFRYASPLDIFLLLLGVTVAVITGAGMPLESILIGGVSGTIIDAAENSSRDYFGKPTKTNSTVDLTEFMAEINKNCILYAYLGVLMFFASYIQMFCWVTTCERQINRIRREFFKAILHQDIAWFDQNQSGALTTKLSDNLERIKEGIGDKFGSLIQQLAQFLAGYVIAFIYSWKLTLVMLALMPLVIIASAIMGKLDETAARSQQEHYSKAGAVAEEVLSCARTVIAFNGQTREAKRYEAELDKGRREGTKKGLYEGASMTAIITVVFSSYGLAFWYGATLITSGQIDKSVVFIVFFSVMFGSFAIGFAAPQMALVNTARAAIASILDIIERKPNIDSYSEDGTIIENPKGRIEFKDVHFEYPLRPDVKVLEGISFAVEPGETLALVGSSGCGKSTTVNLLLRYYDPTSGTITIDGNEVQNLKVHFLRNLIGVVSQEPVLFDATIQENIEFGRLDVTYKEVIQACKLSNAHDFISTLPKGYNTKVGERGTQLSGGQKQRIAIARALVRDPKILLLDEATSALDAESEAIVQEALEKAAQGRTTLIIAHRLSTIRNADKIIALKNGVIKEVGNHTSLMEKEGFYHSLVTSQMFHDAAVTSDYLTETDGKTDDEGPKPEVKHHHIRRQKSDRPHTISMNLQRTISVMTGESDRSEETVTTTDDEVDQKRHSLLTTKLDTDELRLKREIAEEGAHKSNFIDIFTHSREEWCILFIAFIFACLQGFAMPAFSVIYNQIFLIYSNPDPDQMVEGSKWAALLFALFGFGYGLTWVFSLWLFSKAGERLTMRLRLDVFKNILRQDVAFFDDSRHSTGKICTRLATDAPNVKAALDFRLGGLIEAVLSVIAGVCIAFVFGWQLALLVVGILPFAALGAYAEMRVREASVTKDAQLLEEAGKIASEAIDSIRTVQALTREKRFFDIFCHHLDAPYAHAMKQAHVHAIAVAYAYCINFFADAAAFAFGAWLVKQGTLSPLNIMMVVLPISFSTFGIGYATMYFPEFFKARMSAGLIFKLMNIEPKIDSSSTTGLKPDISGTVSFKDVHFAYPSRDQITVLNGLSFELTPGSTLALVGPSGCGKSTVVNLMERFYDPLDGHIGIDDYDLKTINPSYMRQMISLVSQEPVLFDCSIQENIVYGLKDVPFEKVEEAAKLANIHQFILSMPDGYDTRVGEKGTQLSGGQKQRVAIARALVRQPKILLLDEATSALDMESEKIVQEALDKAREGRTCIIIAHRLSTVQSADSIAVIKNGKVVEKGTHASLIADKGAYYQLTKKQNLTD